MDLLNLKKNLEYSKSKRDKLLGKQELLMTDLKKLGYKKISEAKKALDKMQIGIKKKESKLNIETSKFEKEYRDLL